jgi:hypothetical protein
MAQIDWQSIVSGQQQQKKRYAGMNVQFFYAYNENEEKSLKEGRPIFDEIPSISIQVPGGDTTVRRIEPQDIQEYPEKYQAFMSGSEPVTEGTPLAEWPMMTGSAMREFQYLGFKTVEQVANATEDAKRKLGTLSKFVKMAKEWLAAANSDQNDVAKLRVQLEQAQAKYAKLEEKLELFMQRIEANEGTDLRDERVSDSLNDEPTNPPRLRGRPRRV